MIYIQSETPVENQEGLDQLINLSNHSHKIVKVKCDFNISEKCRIIYYTK